MEMVHLYLLIRYTDRYGAVRIWDIAGEENVLKLETRPFAGSMQV